MDPTKEPLRPEANFRILHLAYLSDSATLYCDCIIHDEEINLVIHQNQAGFFELWPKDPPEFKVLDECNSIVVMLDDYHKLHWLIKMADGNVLSRVVHLDPILHSMAEEKFHNQF